MIFCDSIMICGKKSIDCRKIHMKKKCTDRKSQVSNEKNKSTESIQANNDCQLQMISTKRHEDGML